MNDKINFAGGSPAASHFFLLRQRKSNQKEGDPGLPPLRGTLDQPQASGAAQLDLAGRTPRAPLRDSNSARLNLRSLAADRGGAQEKEKLNPKTINPHVRNVFMNPKKLAKWNRWLGDANLDGSIAHELANLAVIREIHSGLKQMVDNNKNIQKHSAFYSVMKMTYSQSALMYIRRQVRKENDSISLIMLAEDVLNNSEQITKEFYSNLYTINRQDKEREQWKRLGERDFVKHFGGTLGDRLDPHIIERDIQKLTQIFHDSKGFIDRRLAHLDKREPNSIPMYSEIESWCDVLNEILRKYMSLIRAADYRVAPILQHDWKSVFRTAWL